MSKRVNLDRDSSDSDSDTSEDEAVGFKRKKRGSHASASSSSSGRKEIIWDSKDKKSNVSKRSARVDGGSGSQSSHRISSSSCSDVNLDEIKADKRSLDVCLSLEEEFNKRLQGGCSRTPSHVTSTSSISTVTSSSSSIIGNCCNGMEDEKLKKTIAKKLDLPKVVRNEVIRPVKRYKHLGYGAQYTDGPSASEIIACMGFETSNGLSRYAKVLAAHRIPVPTLDEIEERIQTLGIVENELVEPFRYAGSIEEVEEEVCWIPPEVPTQFRFEDMRKWRTLGTLQRKLEYALRIRGLFVNNEIVEQLEKCKMFFSEWHEAYYHTIRHRANLFEKVGKGPFICRSAMKMANIDAMLGFALTEPKSHTLEPIVRGNELFYFADICAGPGGFTEYVLWRKKWEAKGFGMTLAGDMDFRLDEFAADSHSFETYYGPAGDGDVYNPANVSGFIEYVLSNSDGLGVHLLMADGGFSVEHQENLQEILSTQIILSQCAIALAIVRQGGNFVCKIFDVFTPFTVGLLYLMYVSFDLVTIHKPNTSRPASSERYLICKLKREGTQPIMEYLLDCHKVLWEISHCEKPQSDAVHILDIVPAKLISKIEHPFCRFLMNSNDEIAKRQIKGIREMIKCAKDPELINEKHTFIAKECFRVWNIPQTIGTGRYLNTSELCLELINPYPKTVLCRREILLNTENIHAIFSSPYDWRVVAVEDRPLGEKRGFYLSTGGHMVYRWSGKVWIFVQLENYKRLELPARTLVYGELVNEIVCGKPAQVVKKTFHIIDALVLGGKDIRYAHYTQRHELCTKFVKAIYKRDPDLIPVKVKNPVRMENVMDILDKLSHRVVRPHGIGSRLVCPTDHTDETSSVILPSGLLFIKITRDPWQMALNRHKKCKYWYNKLTGESTGNVPVDAVSDFYWTSLNRVLWHWDSDTNVVLTEVSCAADPRLTKLHQQKVHAISLLHHVSQAIRTPPYTHSTPSRPPAGAATPPATAKSSL